MLLSPFPLALFLVASGPEPGYNPAQDAVQFSPPPCSKGSESRQALKSSVSRCIAFLSFLGHFRLSATFRFAGRPRGCLLVKSSRNVPKSRVLQRTILVALLSLPLTVRPGFVASSTTLQVIVITLRPPERESKNFDSKGPRLFRPIASSSARRNLITWLSNATC